MKYTFEERMSQWHDWAGIEVNSLLAQFWLGSDVFAAHKLDHNTDELLISPDFLQYGITKEVRFPIMPSGDRH